MFIEIRSATMLLDIKSLYYTFKNSLNPPHTSEKMHLFEYCDFYVHSRNVVFHILHYSRGNRFRSPLKYSWVIMFYVVNSVRKQQVCVNIQVDYMTVMQSCHRECNWSPIKPRLEIRSSWFEPRSWYKIIGNVVT